MNRFVIASVLVAVVGARADAQFPAAGPTYYPPPLNNGYFPGTVSGSYTSSFTVFGNVRAAPDTPTGGSPGYTYNVGYSGVLNPSRPYYGRSYYGPVYPAPCYDPYRAFALYR